MHYFWERTSIPTSKGVGWTPRSTGLNFSEKRKISCPSWDSKPRSSSPQPSHYKDHAIPALSLYNTDVKKQNQILKHPEIKAAGNMVL
jgi:hypothetical protein